MNKDQLASIITAFRASNFEGCISFRGSQPQVIKDLVALGGTYNKDRVNPLVTFDRTHAVMVYVSEEEDAKVDLNFAQTW